jgi:archaellum component FlaG (FlaF/FlaG flagellin family)
VIIATVVISAAAIAGMAFAGAFEKSGSLKSGSTSFTQTIQHPKKIILYPESSQVKTSYSIVCVKGTKVSSLSRSFTTAFTRNLLWHIPKRQDVCYLAVAAATNKDVGQIVVQVSN